MARKKRYRIRNWSKYNKALVKRGSLTLWFDEESISQWHNTQLSGQKGRPFDYSNTAILCALSLRNLFRLPLRATEGMLTSLVEMLELPITVPTYTTLSRRQKTQDIPQYKSTKTDPIHLVVDSTGIKIYGEGEWKMRQHGKEKRRTWRKLHIAVDEATQDIVMSKVTDCNIHDCEVLNDLIPSDTNIKQITGDGAYDTHNCYMAAVNIGAKPCFPPRGKSARRKPTDEGWRLRNHAVSRVREHGHKRWKKKNDYHRRSLSETAFSRLKKIFGDRANSRSFDNQVAELTLRCHMLNKMTELGMPDSVMI